VNDYIELYPDSAARVVENLSADGAVSFMRSRPPAQCAAVFARLTPTAAEAVLAGIEPEIAKELIYLLDPTHAAALLARLAADLRNVLLAQLDDGLRSELEQIMSYPPDSAGALMDPAVMTFAPETTVEQAHARLRTSDVSNKHAVFVVDSTGNLTGRVPMVELAIAAHDARLDALADISPA
jgi:magnesium transporter